MASYRLTRAAADDLASIFLNGLEMFGLAQADAYDGIESTLVFLAAYPRVARMRHEIDPPVRAYPYKAHLIVYDLVDDDILSSFAFVTAARIGSVRAKGDTGRTRLTMAPSTRSWRRRCRSG